MASERQTPWERAKTDSHLFAGWGRSAVVAIVGVALGLLGQAIFGFPMEPVIQALIPVASGVVAVLLLRGGELWLNWRRAPLSLLADDVGAVNERLGALDSFLRSSASPAEEHNRKVRIAAQAVLGELAEIARVMRQAQSAGRFWNGGKFPTRHWDHDWLTLAGQPGSTALIDACRDAYARIRAFDAEARNRILGAKPKLLALDIAQLDETLEAIAEADGLLRAALRSLEPGGPSLDT